MNAPLGPVQFDAAEAAMLARIVDAGMWELVSAPHTVEESTLWDAICGKLALPGYSQPKECGQPTAALAAPALNPAALADAKRFAECTSLDSESIE